MQGGRKQMDQCVFLLSANYITVLLWRQFNDMNTAVGPTAVDTVPPALKSSRHIMKVTGGKKSISSRLLSVGLD